MTDAIPEDLAALIAADEPIVNEDRLSALRDKIARVRDLQKTKADLEARLKETNKELDASYFRELPDLMDAAGVTLVEIPPEGDLPAITAKVGPYYRANIAADWPPERRAAAFKWLDDNGHGDLIKTNVTVPFARDEREEARKLVAKLEAEGLPTVIGEAIPWATLTAWLKEMVEKHNATDLPLETLGATVGRVVTLKSKG